MVNIARVAAVRAFFVLCPPLTHASQPGALSSARVGAAAIIHEINVARANPRLYADLIERMRLSYSGNVRQTPGGIALRTQEGVRALDEAIRFLRSAQPEQTLALSPGLCQAAADHCRDQSGGRMGHHGSDGSNPGLRINRYGAWQGGWAENIAYGQRSAREIVMALIIDDGVRGRGHRRNIFNASYNVAGAAYGPHARFGAVCDIDFAAAYQDRGVASAQSRASDRRSS
ncbi:MAG: CAP domain-containing protein [Verrucomicrobia bacterium]|nr:CAP domain-containing protein [Verrucomicrobiota bacterium]